MPIIGEITTFVEIILANNTQLTNFGFQFVRAANLDSSGKCIDGDSK
jgi:hypothetical protein